MSNARQNWLKFYETFSEGYDQIVAIFRLYGTNKRYVVHQRSSDQDARQIVWIIGLYNGDTDQYNRGDSLEYETLESAIESAKRYQITESLNTFVFE